MAKRSSSQPISYRPNNLQNECQKHICCDLNPSQCVDQRVTDLTPVIILVAWHHAIEFNEDGLPVPEPAVTNREDKRRYSKAPDKEINSDIPARVDWPAVALEKSEEEDKRVIEEGEEDLRIPRSVERPSKGSRR